MRWPLRACALVLGVLAAQSASAEPAASHVGLGMRAGVLVPFSALDPGLTIGADVGYALPVLGRRLVLGLGLGLAQPLGQGVQADPRFVPSAFTWDVMERQLGLDVRLSARLPSFGPRLSPSVTIGPRLYVLETCVAGGVGRERFSEECGTATRLGGLLTVGVAHPLGDGALVGELELAGSKPDHTRAGDFSTLGLAIRVGWWFSL